jgi:hypothetical protein
METWSASASNGLGTGGKSNKRRSETVSVRLDPKLRYLAELASRKQRRTLSSFIEWAIDESLKSIVIGVSEENPEGPPRTDSIADVANVLWDVEPADRFAKLAYRYPYMLDHIEELIWKLVFENEWFWKGIYTDSNGRPSRIEQNLDFERLRRMWNMLNKVARGEVPKSALLESIEREDEDLPF